MNLEDFKNLLDALENNRCEQILTVTFLFFSTVMLLFLLLASHSQEEKNK